MENFIDESEFNKENLKQFFSKLLFNEQGQPIQFIEKSEQPENLEILNEEEKKEI